MDMGPKEEEPHRRTNSKSIHGKNHPVDYLVE